ncbi:hypothetical protein [Gordonia aichiensis]|uniref:hypothetical protein n=1 Tax=Gordonia aichiensis TaxID=36820 RepID=UPI0032649674
MTVIDSEQARQIPPHLCAPPMCTTDAKKTGVGAAHGRVLPLVGNTRPYLYDVTIVGTDDRIYADRLTDVLGVLIGEQYFALAEQIDALGVRDTTDDGASASVGDLFPPEIAAAAEPDEDEPTPFDSPERIRAHQELQNLLYEMALLRTAFAARIRITLQQAINADAVASGLWDQLTDFEKEELTVSATEGGGFPIGIPAEVPVVINAETAPQTVLMVRPEWRAETRLVINTGDYNPWTDAPTIETIRQATDADGEVFDYPTDENVVSLTIDTEEELIDSLVQAGFLTCETRPAYQLSDLYTEFTDDPVAQPFLRRNQESDPSSAQVNA